jgi:hypothetical protein
LFVIVGNPSAGGAYGWPLLPGFWAAVGPWLPPGAATDAIRGAVYFGNAAITRDLLVLGGYALAGLVVSYVVLMLAGRRPGLPTGPGPPAWAAAIPDRQPSRADSDCRRHPLG